MARGIKVKAWDSSTRSLAGRLLGLVLASECGLGPRPLSGRLAGGCWCLCWRVLVSLWGWLQRLQLPRSAWCQGEKAVLSGRARQRVCRVQI